MGTMYIHCETNVYVTVLILFVSCISCDYFHPGNAINLLKHKLILNSYVDRS